MGKPQFSIRLMLLTVAAFAVVLALMFQTKPAIGCSVLVILVMVASGFAIIGLTNGQPRLRAFCTGALLPLGIMIAWFATNLSAFTVLFQAQGTDDWESTFPRPIGAGILSSIALGYLCVGFRWLIERSNK